MKGVTSLLESQRCLDATVEVLQGEARQVPEPIEMAYDLHEDGVGSMVTWGKNRVVSHEFLCIMRCLSYI